MSAKEYKTEHLMDLARYGSLLGHIQNNPDISTFVAVCDKDIPIHVVGDAMVDGNTELVEQLMAEGKLKVCASMMRGDHGLIPHENCIECLYLPPIYLVKNRGVKYE